MTAASLNLPTGWELIRLADSAAIVRGVSFPSDAKSYEHLDGYIGCLRTTNVQREVELSSLWFIPRKYVKAEQQIVQPYDILISTANSFELVGKVAQVKALPVDATLGAFISLIRPHNELDPKFIYYQLASTAIQETIRSLASTTTNLSNVSTSKLAEVSVAISPLPEQRRIVAEIERQFSLLDAGVANLKRVQANLKRYRASVLQAACEGRLVPTEAELARTEGRDYEPADVLLSRILAERRERWLTAQAAKKDSRAKLEVDPFFGKKVVNLQMAVHFEDVEDGPPAPILGSQTEAETFASSVPVPLRLPRIGAGGQSEALPLTFNERASAYDADSNVDPVRRLEQITLNQSVSGSDEEFPTRLFGRQFRYDHSATVFKGYKEPAVPDTSTLSPLPEGWTWTSLAAVADIRLGKMLSPKAYEPDLVQLPYLRNENVRWGVVDFSDVKRMGFKPNEIDRFQVNKGDLLVCEGGEAGRCSVFRRDSGEFMYQKAIHRVRCLEKSVLVELLQFCFQHYVLSKTVIPRPSETTIQHLPLEKMEVLPIPLPPLAEQERIVAEVERLLSVVDNLEQVVKANLKRADRLRQSILKDAFAGRLVPQDPADEPASALLERIKAKREAEAKAAAGSSRKKTAPPKTSVAGLDLFSESE